MRETIQSKPHGVSVCVCVRLRFWCAKSLSIQAKSAFAAFEQPCIATHQSHESN